MPEEQALAGELTQEWLRRQVNVGGRTCLQDRSAGRPVTVPSPRGGAVGQGHGVVAGGGARLLLQ